MLPDSYGKRMLKAARGYQSQPPETQIASMEKVRQSLEIAPSDVSRQKLLNETVLTSSENAHKMDSSMEKEVSKVLLDRL